MLLLAINYQYLSVSDYNQCVLVNDINFLRLIDVGHSTVSNYRDIAYTLLC